MAEDFKTLVGLADFLLKFGVVPLLILLWQLNNNINALRTLLYKEFVTKAEHEKDMDGLKWRHGSQR